ncbi:MAG: hypothetical protein WBH03_21390 [Cyclobacteriaceae bacterium]
MGKTLANYDVIPRSKCVGGPGPHSSKQIEWYRDWDVFDLLMGLRWLQHANIRPIKQLDAHRSPSFNDSLGKAASASNHLGAMADDADWYINRFIRRLSLIFRRSHSFTSAQDNLRFGWVRYFTDAAGRMVIRLGSNFGDDMHNEVARPGPDSSAWARHVPAYAVRQAADKMRAILRAPRSHAQIRSIQARVGTRPDGAYGKGTLAAVSAKQTLWRVDTTYAGGRVNTRGLWCVRTDAAYQRRVSASVKVAPALRAFGFPVNPSGVGRYQRANGLTVDELAGRKTISHMEASMAQLDRIERNTKATLALANQILSSIQTIPRRVHDRRFGPNNVKGRPRFKRVVADIAADAEGANSSAKEAAKAAQKAADAATSAAAAAKQALARLDNQS